jgi:YD repeat-containing protein
MRGGRTAVAAAASLLAATGIVLVGRLEARHDHRAERAGLLRVAVAAPRMGDRSLSGYRIPLVGPDMDCLLYARNGNPYALQLCYDPQGRLVEAVDRRGRKQVFWSVVPDPQDSPTRLSRPKLDSLLHRLELIPH